MADVSNTLRPIGSAIDTPPARPIHPDPRRDKLRLEAPSPRELSGSASGEVFAVDTPYWVVWSGFGEWWPAFE